MREKIRLPDAAIDLSPGDLVHYRRWCPDRRSWITDGIPLLVTNVLRDGVALVLTEMGVVTMPINLLKKSETSFTFFASIV